MFIINKETYKYEKCIIIIEMSFVHSGRLNFTKFININLMKNTNRKTNLRNILQIFPRSSFIGTHDINVSSSRRILL